MKHARCRRRRRRRRALLFVARLLNSNSSFHMIAATPCHCQVTYQVSRLMFIRHGYSILLDTPCSCSLLDTESTPSGPPAPGHTRDKLEICSQPARLRLTPETKFRLAGRI
jgi:hypothetical protein